ncbi:MAG: extracellular solute-binding protein [Lachnospiraceae bacterium]|nr:extracellular solute-binding protein [Lachnospiraceae bacterium]
MRKKALALLLVAACATQLVACSGGGTGDTGSTNQNKPDPGKTNQTEDANGGSELVDGKFKETKKITVEVYNRNNDGGTDPKTNMYAQYIKDGMLKDHNVEVEFVDVSRWEEVTELNNLLAAGTAPDICVTYDYATIKTYADRNGVQDLSKLVEENKDITPHLWDWLGETNIYWDKDPETGTLWAIEGKRATSNRIVTFIRQDWLDELKLKEPTTKKEFEETLIAFRDNADKLLGENADKMIPYSVSYDVGWRAATLIESFIDPDISQREFYVNGFDDRKLTENGTKEAVRLLNKWYNDDLLWKDFTLYGSGDTTEDDFMKSGYVGAFSHNWDYPFRNGADSINASLKRLVGEDAKFVAIDPFEDSKGGHTKYVTSTAGDRKIFFPKTNDEPLASLLYLDWISDPEHIQYLQLGDEGVTCEKLADGSYKSIAATGDAIINSQYNIDYTITCNGLNLGDAAKTAATMANSYAEIEPELVVRANEIANIDAVHEQNVNVGNVESENGMGTTLGEKRDICYDKAVAAPVADFDKTWDQYYKDYMSAGGKEIQKEREEKWVSTYGDVQELPKK